MAANDVLIDTEELAGRLDDDSIAIVEVDEDTDAYAAGHIPGAVMLHWEEDLQSAAGRDFVSGEELADLLASRGISDDQTIVLYGGNNNWFAAYAYWLLAYRGVSNVRLLDGGRTKWELEERPTTTDVEDPTPGSFSVGEPRPGLRVFRDEVIEVAEAGDGSLVDVRSPGEFSGEVMAPPHLPQEQPYVAGHVPGASNIPCSQAANEDGSFKSVDELRALYEGAGIGADDPVIAYCRIGERSSHTWFVLHELLGNHNARNYDGSWTEYGSLVGVPVELGS